VGEAFNKSTAMPLRRDAGSAPAPVISMCTRVVIG
jgi:hypothetical protein